jgi:hypothetical protein
LIKVAPIPALVAPAVAVSKSSLIFIHLFIFLSTACFHVS